MKAIVLISGGMDSLVSTAIAKRDGYDLAALHLNYGRRIMASKKNSWLMLRISHALAALRLPIKPLK
jgi:7-cyano-7-deazaguanine synthase